jgi:hypothetical protein
MHADYLVCPRPHLPAISIVWSKTGQCKKRATRFAPMSGFMGCWNNKDTRLSTFPVSEFLSRSNKGLTRLCRAAQMDTAGKEVTATTCGPISRFDADKRGSFATTFSQTHRSFSTTCLPTKKMEVTEFSSFFLISVAQRLSGGR